MDSLKDLDKKLVVQIDITSRISKLFSTKFHEKYISEEISADEFAILIALTLSPAISQSQIGRDLCKGKAHIGKMLNNMANKGFIERTITNNQTTLNKITQKGQDLFHSGIKTINEILDVNLNREFSGEEQEQFISFLSRYRKVLSEIADFTMK